MTNIDSRDADYPQDGRPPIPKRAVFVSGNGGSKTIVTHLMTLHSGNLLPDRQSWLITRYLITPGGCYLSQVQVDDTHVKDPAMFAGPGELENPQG
jgi:hypothetical protein